MHDFPDPAMICSVFSMASASREYTHTSGVFLSPSKVLTTYSNGQNLSEVTFENDRGEKCLSAYVEPVAEHKQLGISIVELEQPIGTKFARIPQGDYSLFMIGSLVSAFERSLERYPVIWDIRYSMFSVSQAKEKMVSLSSSPIFTSQSMGCPVMSPDGMTLATMIADFADAGDQMRSLGLVDILEIQSGRPAQSGTAFMATNPRFFHTWIQEQAREFNLA